MTTIDIVLVYLYHVTDDNTQISGLYIKVSQFMMTTVDNCYQHSENNNSNNIITEC